MVEQATAPNISAGRMRFAAKLGRALDYADRCMQTYRHNRGKMIREYGGSYHGHGKPEKASPINALFGLAQVFLPAIAFDGSARIAAKRDPRNGPFAKLFELNLNDVLEEIRFGEFLERATLEAILGAAVAYTGIARGAWRGLEDQEGYLHDPDEPFVELISPDAWLPDPNARCREEMIFEGHRFTVSFEWAMDQKDLWTRRDLLEKLDPSRREHVGERAEDIHRAGIPTTEDRVRDEIELIKLWLPEHQTSIILPGDPNMSEDVLAEAPHEGLEEGPYDHLAFADVPDNAVPLSIGGIMMDLHDLLNTLGRKARRQAENQKDFWIYDLAAEEDAETIRNAQDQYFIGVRDVNRFKSMSQGGVNESNWRAIAEFKSWFNYQAGNPEGIGGLSAQSKTLGQDQMLYQSASAKIAFWRKRMTAFSSKIFSKIGYYLWTDPIRQVELVQVIAGNLPVVRTWTPNERRGQFEDYRITAAPYGFQSDTLEAQYSRLMNFLQNFFLPLAPMAAQNGEVPNAAVILEVAGELGNIPRADEFITTANEMQDAAQMQLSGLVGAPGNSTTNNISLGGRARPGLMPAAVQQRQEAERETL